MGHILLITRFNLIATIATIADQLPTIFESASAKNSIAAIVDFSMK